MNWIQKLAQVNWGMLVLKILFFLVVVNFIIVKFFVDEEAVV